MTGDDEALIGVFGEPEDVAGECNARLFIGDNFGDNHATMRCQRHDGHEGKHFKTFRNGLAEVAWEIDERAVCGSCGIRIPAEHGDFCPTDDCEFEGCKDCLRRHMDAPHPGLRVV